MHEPHRQPDSRETPANMPRVATDPKLPSSPPLNLKSCARWLTLDELNSLPGVEATANLYRTRGFVVEDDSGLERLVRENWNIALHTARNTNDEFPPRLTVKVHGTRFSVFGVSHPMIVRVGMDFTSRLNKELESYSEVFLEPGLGWAMRIRRDDAIKIPDTRLVSSASFLKEGLINGLCFPLLAVDVLRNWGSNLVSRFTGKVTEDERDIQDIPASGWSLSGLPPGFAIELLHSRKQSFPSCTLRSAFVAACMQRNARGGSRAAVVGALHSGEIIHFLKHPYPPAVALAESFFTEKKDLTAILRNVRAPMVFGASFFLGASPYMSLIAAACRALS